MIIDILFFLIVLCVIIFIHELGHFFFAKKAGILCHEFAIGMGPVIYQKKVNETVYSLRAIPLGGYVSMAGEEFKNLVQKDQRIGLVFDDKNYVKEIILTNDVEFDVFGTVNDFDLLGNGLDGEDDLYIELLIRGEFTKYVVSKDAFYILSEKKKMQLAPKGRSYDDKTLWQRFLVVFSGPAANFILAFFLLFVLAFFIGKPTNKNIVGKIDPNFNTELKQGDFITSVDGKDVLTFNDIYKTIYDKKSNKVNMVVDGNMISVDLMVVIQGIGIRNQIGVDEVIVGQPFGKEKDLKNNDKILKAYFSNEKDLISKDINYIDINNWTDLIVYSEENSNLSHIYLEILRDDKVIHIDYGNIPAKTLAGLGSPYIVYSAGFQQTREFNILYPFYYPFKVISSDMKEMFNTIKYLFVPNTGVGAGDLSGPVGIFSMVSQARKSGISTFIQFVAFLSVNIGLLNLLPIPALDGGRLVFIGYEAITKKKVNKKVENTLILITFVLLFTLMIFVTFKDIIRIF